MPSLTLTRRQAPSAQVVTVPTGAGSGQLCVQMFRLETTDEDRSAYQRASAPAPVVATASAPVRSSRKANTFARRLLSFIFTNEGAHGIVIGVNKPVCAPIAEELRVNQGSAIAQLRRLGLIEEFELEPPHARVLTLKNINWVRTRVSAAGVDLLLQKSG